jgi:hypothetical protein
MLSAGLLLVVAAGLFAAWWLQPARLAAFATSRLGDALDLSIRYDQGRMTLRPLPRLVLHHLRVGQPGHADFLRADQVDISMPWATVRGGGAVLDFDRVEITAPSLDLAGLQRWLASRPPSEVAAPRFARGLHVRDGAVTASDWRIGDLALDTPRWQPGAPADLTVRGRWQATGSSATLELQQRLHLDRVAMATPLQLDGSGIAVLSGAHIEWRQRLTAHAQGSASAWRLTGLRLAADLEVQHDGRHAAAALGLAARTLREDRANGRLDLAPFALVASGDDPMPQSIRLLGTAQAGTALRLHLQGEASNWPAAWPALPQPLADSAAPITATLDFRARAGQPARLDFDLQRAPTRLQGRFDPAALAAWWRAPDTTPLPPISGRMSTPRLDLGGAQLEGVEIELHDDHAPPAQ